MLRFDEADVAGDAARALLTAYFGDRALGFPTAQGVYRPTWPEPSQFTPPAGVFLITQDDDDRAVGCGGVRRVQRGDEGLVRFEVKHLWLDPSRRGRGDGRRMLAELERRAIGFGAQELVLDTNASLEAAGALYRSSGYAEIAPYNANPNATHWFGKRVGGAGS